MKLRIFILTLISIINLIFQSTMFNYVNVISILPNTMLVLVLSYGVLRSDFDSMIFGFCNGLMFDVFFGRAIGFYALLGLITGYISAKPFKEFNPSNFLSPLVVILVGSICYESTFYFFAFLFRGKINFLFYLINIILPETVLNMIVGLIIYPLFFFINRRLETHEKPKRKMFSSIGGNSGKI